MRVEDKERTELYMSHSKESIDGLLMKWSDSEEETDEIIVSNDLLKLFVNTFEKINYLKEKINLVTESEAKIVYKAAGELRYIEPNQQSELKYFFEYINWLASGRKEEEKFSELPDTIIGKYIENAKIY